MTPEQTRAVEYLRRAGTGAPVAEIRRKVSETFRELDELVAGIPEEVVRVRPRPGRWCVQEVVDHLILSHRPAGEELACLLRGEKPPGDPVPAHLQSPDVMEKDWPALVREMSAVHGRFASLVAEASEDTPLEVRAPLVMVIQGMEWLEELDWKAYAVAFRAHALGHAAQVRAILAELSLEGEKKEERPEENSRS
ncbi:MAG TPA: DinB family protein [Thermoanaerobaculia bacterium]|nr:DinB family protein [Thermoanaerobaculia bacterium]